MTTRSDLLLTKDDWTNVTSLAGRLAGAKLLVQNMGSNNIRIYHGLSAPANGAFGNILEPYDIMALKVDSGENIYCYTAFSNHFVNVDKVFDIDPNYAEAVKDIKAQFDDDVVLGRKSLHKFGANEDVGTAIADISLTAQIGDDREALQTSNTINTISSANASDVHDITIEGMALSGGDFTFVKQVATLNGQNKVTLETPLARCTRLQNLNGAATLGRVYAYRDTAISGGVPTDTSMIHNILARDDETSLRAATSIASNNYFICTGLYASLDKTNSTKVKVRFAYGKQGKVFKTKTVQSTTQSDRISHEFKPPLIIEPNSDIVMTAESSSSGTAVYAGFSGVFADIV